MAKIHRTKGKIYKWLKFIIRMRKMTSFILKTEITFLPLQYKYKKNDPLVYTQLTDLDTILWVGVLTLLGRSLHVFSYTNLYSFILSAKTNSPFIKHHVEKFYCHLFLFINLFFFYSKLCSILLHASVWLSLSTSWR